MGTQSERSNRRMKRTRQRLRQAFMDVMQEKGFTSIHFPPTNKLTIPEQQLKRSASSSLTQKQYAHLEADPGRVRAEWLARDS